MRYGLGCMLMVGLESGSGPDQDQGRSSAASRYGRMRGNSDPLGSISRRYFLIPDSAKLRWCLSHVRNLIADNQHFSVHPLRRKLQTRRTL